MHGVRFAGFRTKISEDDMQRITMNTRSFQLAMSHFLTFAQETQQSTEAGGVITLNPVVAFPKLDYVGNCLIAILSSCANATGEFQPYNRLEIAKMLEDCAHHFRATSQNPSVTL